jgi:hypothetical protein
VGGGGDRWPAGWGGGDGTYTIFRVLVICRANDGILQQQTGSGITLLGGRAERKKFNQGTGRDRRQGI